MTGAWTNSALGAAALVSASASSTLTSAAAQASAHQLLFNAKCIGCYMFGSVISGLVVPDPEAFRIDVPKSLWLFGMASGFLTIATAMSRASNINYLFCCCLATGIQNSFTSTMSANSCRTSHFSGITSDMGTFLGQLARGNAENAPKLKTSALLVASFWTGGFLSVACTRRYGGLVFLGTAVVDLAVAGYLGLRYHRMTKPKAMVQVYNHATGGLSKPKSMAAVSTP